MPETWLSREVPVLEAVARLGDRLEPGSSMLGVEEVAAEAGCDRDTAIRSLLALIEAGYVSGRPNPGDDRIMSIRGIELLERGRRAVGSWPREEGGLEVLLELLADQIDAEPDEEKKSRLKRLREAAQDVGKDVGTSLLTAWFKSVSGLP